MKLALSLTLLLTAANFASEPRTVIVGSRGAAVLSGVADESYICDRLRAGAEVEVYDEPAPGFLAIRPPSDCRSWVRNSALEVHRDGTATVREAGAACRIGRERGPGPEVQVWLEAGEEVTVVGKPEGLWRPIAPPSGEFRYIRARDTKQSNAEANGWNRRTQQDSDEQLELTAHADDRDGANDDSFLAPPLANEPANVPAPLPMPPTPGEPVAANPAPLVFDKSPSSTGAPAPAEPFQQSLNRLEANLARMVAERPNMWQFDELEREAARLFSFATTEEQKSAVRAVAARMDRFAVLAARYRELRVGDEVAPTVARTDDPTLGSATGYDAIGTLRPVVSKSGDAPQYALVDDQGKLLTLITPSPDVNLQSLLGRRVAVRGTKGYLPKFQQPHLTANRVSPVENLRR